MGRGQVRTLLAGNTGKVFHRMGEGSGRAATGDARGVADEEARSRKAREGICRKVILIPNSYFLLVSHRHRLRIGRHETAAVALAEDRHRHFEAVLLKLTCESGNR
jgi:hypothetical protein